MPTHIKRHPYRHMRSHRLGGLYQVREGNVPVWTPTPEERQEERASLGVECACDTCLCLAGIDPESLI